MCDGVCSNPSPTRPISSCGIMWHGPIATFTGTTVRNSPQSAGRRPTKTGSRPLTPYIRRFSRGSIPTGPRCKNFQRTRGVLRLMASVIHSLWDNGDRSPLIMPANILLDDPPVQSEINRYLPDNWPPVIERDIDGPNSLPSRIDGEAPNLGRYGACRRVARSIFLGSAPIQAAANQGLEDRRIKLGCVNPGEPPAIFGDAMRRMANTAAYLYQDGARYWYSTQPTVATLADGRAEEYRRNRDPVDKEIEERLRADLRNRGDFKAVHVLPASGQDVQDDHDARLVVLGPNYPHTREQETDSRAVSAAKAIWEFRGSTPRLFRNGLAFLAPDQVRLQDLEDAVRHYLAWQSILNDRERLDLPPHQVRQAGKPEGRIRQRG